MSRAFAAILLVVVLVVGGGVIATAAYQAGVNNAVTTTTQSGGGTAVAPVVVPAYGYGIGFWHPFGWIFGFFATIFFLFIVFAPGPRDLLPGGRPGPAWRLGSRLGRRDGRDRATAGSHARTTFRRLAPAGPWNRARPDGRHRLARRARPGDTTSRTPTPPSGPYARPDRTRAAPAPRPRAPRT